jgi:hypothetical protein
MLRSCSRVIALTAMVAGSSVTAQAADTTLMLACEGTKTFRMEGGNLPLERTAPISLGIIVNLTARTLTGLQELDTTPVTSINESTISFSYSHRYSDGALVTVSGTIDRLTGAMAATTTNGYAIWSYSLKCTPTQRMF